jgi:ElaB/YqjD/DUF883 family membrane-anchored ribosome-binding protein
LIYACKFDNLNVLVQNYPKRCATSSPSLLFTARFAMSESTDLSAVNKEKLVSDMKIVVADAEEILRATASVAGEKVGELRERIQDRLRDAKIRIADAEAALLDKTKAAARATDDFVHENPWRAVGISAGVGLLLGIIIGRR